MNRQKIIAIDFDGTIVRHEFPEIGEFMPGAAEAIRSLHENYKIIIWTVRDAGYLKVMKRFLDDNKIPYDAINDVIVGVSDFSESRKIYADYYIDDRNFPGGFPGWDVVMGELNKI